MENKQITVGLPFYNPGKYLELAIISVLSQTYQNWRLILLDDGSTDQISNLIALKYSKTDNRISFLSDGENKGLVYRLNQLTSKLESEYYARMDADDIMYPTRLEKQILFLESNKDKQLCGSHAVIINEKNELNRGLNFLWPKSKINFLKSNTVIHPTLLIRSSWARINKYDEKWTRMEDLELWFRSFESSQCGLIEENLLFYRKFARSYKKVKLTEINKRKFYNHLKKKENLLTFKTWILLLVVSTVKQIVYPFLMYINANYSRQLSWDVKLDSLYILRNFQSKSSFNNA